jgi:hypothetical protein
MYNDYVVMWALVEVISAVFLITFLLAVTIYVMVLYFRRLMEIKSRKKTTKSDGKLKYKLYK